MGNRVLEQTSVLMQKQAFRLTTIEDGSWIKTFLCGKGIEP